MKPRKNKIKSSKNVAATKRRTKTGHTVGELLGRGRHLWKSDADFKHFIDILNENSKR